MKGELSSWVKLVLYIGHSQEIHFAMADAIGRGITAGGAEAEVTNVSSCQVSDLDGEEVFATWLSLLWEQKFFEESEMEPLLQTLKEK